MFQKGGRWKDEGQVGRTRKQELRGRELTGLRNLISKAAQEDADCSSTAMSCG